MLSLAALSPACEDVEGVPTGSGGAGGSTPTTAGTGGTSNGGTAGASTGGTGGGMTTGGTGGASNGGSGGGGAGGTGGTGGAAGYSFTVVKGFTGAESCLWDPVSEHWYVSNIAPPVSGDLTELDGEGWISKVDKDLNLVEEKWVMGLDTPAGLRLLNGELFVCNISQIHGFEVATGDLVETHIFPSAVLLNDPAIDAAKDMVYATDTFGDAIYEMKIGQVGSEALLVASAELMGPNGLLFDAGKLYVGSLVDFNPANLGPFLSVNPNSKAITQVGTTLGKWDGLEKWQGAYLLSDNAAGKLVLIQPDGTSEVLFDLFTDHGFAPAADIGVDPATGTICVPNLGDSVGFITVN
ncbi:MAG: hypothetical protein R3F14_16040 [Polyangiaceae bacterium]